jgi:hypothetical protein
MASTERPRVVEQVEEQLEIVPPSKSRREKAAEEFAKYIEQQAIHDDWTRVLYGV